MNQSSFQARSAEACVGRHGSAGTVSGVRRALEPRARVDRLGARADLEIQLRAGGAVTKAAREQLARPHLVADLAEQPLVVPVQAQEAPAVVEDQQQSE